VTGIGNAKPKVGKGTTAVKFRFHAPPEFIKLSSEQKTDLNAYRDAREAASHGLRKKVLKGNKKQQHKNKDTKADMKALISAAHANALKPATKPAASTDKPHKLVQLSSHYLMAAKPLQPNLLYLVTLAPLQ
jgi:hypothetical protein